MATTPVYKFPYPVGTDKVVDGDNAIQALATAVETALRETTTWVTIPLSGGVGGQIQVRLWNGVIFWRGLVTGLPAGAATTIVEAGVLAAKFRPVQGIVRAMGTTTTASLSRGSLGTDGAMLIGTTSSAPNSLDVSAFSGYTAT
jgi:hypothetical protein